MKTTTEPNALTDLNKQELFRLMYGVLFVPIKTVFDMDYYAVSTESVEASENDDDICEIDPHEVENECGTTACFAGHGPIFCINDDICDEWRDYISNTFGVRALTALRSFLFSSSWTSVKEQACARAYQFLTDGLPGDWCGIGHDLEYEKTYPVPSLEQCIALGQKLGVDHESVVARG